MNTASRIGIGSSIGLLASFLLPWIQIMGFGASGYNLSQLGSYGNLAWVVPVVGIVCLLTHTSRGSTMRARKSVSMIGALLLIGGMFFVIARISERVGEGIWHAIGIGVYVLLISSLALFISGYMAPLEPADKTMLARESLLPIAENIDSAFVFGLFGGCLVMAIFLFVIRPGVYLALGAERAFEPDSYEISTLWLVVSVVVTLCGAVASGFVCAAISKSKRSCEVLAFIVFLAVILLCIPALKRDNESPHVRAGEVPTMQAMQLAVTPNWMHLLSPVLGAAGVLLGARMKVRAP
jgi:hypothetical protein